jgi:hypothetical protein
MLNSDAEHVLPAHEELHMQADHQSWDCSGVLCSCPQNIGASLHKYAQLEMDVTQDWLCHTVCKVIAASLMPVGRSATHATKTASN